MKKFSSAIGLALVAALLVATVAFALITNGDFETGDFSGWTKSAFLNNGRTNPPGTGGADLSAVVGGPGVTALSLSDPNTNGILKYPAYGSYSARVNSQDSWSDGGYGKNANTITQTVPAVLDPVDGLWHIRFAYAAVAVDPSHSADQQPYVRVLVTNTSNSNDVIYDFLSYVGEPGKSWQNGATNIYGEQWKFIDWTYVDLTSSVAHPVVAGNNIKIEITAAGCSPSGHPGYAYLDSVTDGDLPGPTIDASGPATAVAGAPITYTYNYNNGAAAPINATVTITPPTNVTFTSLGDAVNCSGLNPVVCNFAGVPAGSGGSFTVSGTISATAGNTTIAHGNYFISATGFPTVGGKTVLTTVSAIPAPGAFGKTSPANNATNVALNTPLTWGTSSNATSYEYCIETDGNNVCDGVWTNIASTTASPTLAAGFIYNWQVRAAGNGTTYADGGTWWNFSTIPANTAPVANNDGYSTPVGTLLNGTTVLVNDTDADLNPLTAVLVTGPAHAASFTLNSNGTFAYTPAAAFSGVDTFTYKANDGTVDSNVATVTINVVPTLTITASGAATVKPGDQYVYTFNYTRNATTTNTMVGFSLPGHATFVSNTGGFTCIQSGDEVNCTLGTVSANGSFTATVLIDKLKKVNTPLTLNTGDYSIIADAASHTTGTAAVTANTVTPFADVPAGHLALDYIQSIWAYGITGGCVSSPLTYCPSVNITRAEMAIYIERAVHGSTFNPGTPTLTYTDTSTSFAKYFIEALKVDGITNGCTPTTFCPTSPIMRNQMSFFLLRGRSGSSYAPAPATGTVWLDVSATTWGAAWMEELGTAHISVGCRPGYFCPNNYVSRSEMAVLVQRTFGLPMPTP